MGGGLAAGTLAHRATQKADAIASEAVKVVSDYAKDVVVTFRSDAMPGDGSIDSLLAGLPPVIGATEQVAVNTPKWIWSASKGVVQTLRQMTQRGWTPKQITEAIAKGVKFAAPNRVNAANTATRYVHPETGRSVVVDDVTQEILHVGGDGFKY